MEKINEKTIGSDSTPLVLLSGEDHAFGNANFNVRLMREIMKIIKLMPIFAFLASCATQTTKLHSGSAYSILSSKCDGKCAEVVKARFPEFRFGVYGARISPALVKRVDSYRGQNSYGGELKFNSDLDGGYELNVEPGERTLELQVNNYMAGFNESVVVNVSFAEGGRYFVGQVIKAEGEGLTYSWAPVIYSYTSGKLLESDKLNKLYSK